MRIDIRVRGLPAPDAAREQARRSLRFALGRFAGEVAQVVVTLEDQNGPRGGVDKRCRLRATLTRGGPPLVIEDEDEHLLPALQRAADRLARRVSRHLDRRLTTSRRPARA